MKLIANYHTHLALCGHAVGTMEEYIQSAINNGFLILGISDHGPILRKDMSDEEYRAFWLDLQMNMDDFMTKYLPEYQRLYPIYQKQIELHLGLEIEYFKQMEPHLRSLRSQLEYMILGVHYFPFKDHLYNTYELMTSEHVLAYAKTVEEALSTGLYKILAHPDLFLYQYKNEDSYIFDAAAQAASKRIIEAAIKNNVYLEINVGGFHRESFYESGILKYGYPRKDFWEIVKTYPDAKVIIGVDAHDPLHLGHPDIQKAIQFANEIQISFEKKVDI